MSVRRPIILILVILLVTSTVSAKRVLFYEIGSGAYSIEKDYSKFAEELRNKGYEVASIEKGSLTKDKLENYDILVVQNLNKQLDTTEISSIIWFVLQKGRGLLINGGGQGKANQLTIPFGATVDTGILIDTSDMIPALNDRSSFTITRFEEDQSMAAIRRGVSKIGFYQDSGIILSGNSKCIATGNGDTYSDTGSFASGSQPCVASASLFGGGLVLTLSDADTLGNKYLNDYNNKNFGLNIMEWLSLATQEISVENDTNTLHLRIKELRLNNLKLEQELNRTQMEKDTLTNQLNTISLEMIDLTSQISELEEGMIGPFSRGNWAIIVLGVLILVAAIVYSKKKNEKIANKEGDLLDELGYELESSNDKKNADKKDDDLENLNL